MNVPTSEPTGDSPSGKALVSGTSIRGFESLIPSQVNRPTKVGLFTWLVLRLRTPRFAKQNTTLEFLVRIPHSEPDATARNVTYVLDHTIASEIKIELLW